jgi:hypothetical protein
MKQLDEFEARQKLQGLSKLQGDYGSFEIIHGERREQIVAELLNLFRIGESHDLIVRKVAQLNALEEFNIEFKNKLGEIRKCENRLKELENDRKSKQERDTFDQYHGG